ncbi:hypothetical protein CALVIDRAFT_467694, partial [Calocera viscosa TUFC12733]
PDISYAISALGQFNANPGREHWLAVKRVLRYLAGTKEMGLVLAHGGEHGLVGWSDADWAGDHEDRKSTSGYIFMLDGMPISWSARKQKTVALSTTEAEYIALTYWWDEALWLRTLLSDLGIQLNGPTTLYVDNQSALSLIRNPVLHSRTKHIDIRHHFIRNAMDASDIELIYCPTDQMVADILTKPLTMDKHHRFADMLGL